MWNQTRDGRSAITHTTVVVSLSGSSLQLAPCHFGTADSNGMFVLKLISTSFSTHHPAPEVQTGNGSKRIGRFRLETGSGHSVL